MRIQDHIHYRSFQLRRALRRLGYWITDNIPVDCARCGSWMLSKDAKKAQPTNSPKLATVCRKCYDELYKPFSSGKDS